MKEATLGYSEEKEKLSFLLLLLPFPLKHRREISP
jgi:hypothetical protein